MKLFLRIFLYIIGFFICFGLGQSFGALISGLSYKEMMAKSFDSNPFQMMWMEIFGAAFTLLLTWLFLSFDREKLNSLGFSFNPNQWLQGFVLGGIFIWLFFVLLLFLNQIELKDDLVFNSDFIYISIALFFAAFIEEIVFRGYIMTKFFQKTTEIKALLFSSFIFAAFHLMNPNLSVIAILEIFFAGIIIGYAYLKTKNIWFVTCLHWGWNWLQTMVGYNVSGQDFYSVLNFSHLEQNVWTGGNFGFEGSILSVISMILMYGILATMKTKKLTNFNDSNY